MQSPPKPEDKLNVLIDEGQDMPKEFYLLMKLISTTITVFVPMAWRCHGGRKVIVAPPGSENCAPAPKIDRALLKALARAHRWRRLLEEGRFGTLAELAEAERISRSYVCRVLRLTLLAPDIVERILDGRPTAGLAQFLKPFPVAWETQRQRLL